ncbi:MAG TPA: hypothetical protein VGZ32_04310 [Actinocrinis sp.]|uniref:hypothetical protein n=1 Tax=Actinocrinis sp. TaxID=1920516 RepID=UPI002DDD5354|nr:hypothetical protein [Actinocrinis sp.]HEV3169534.1 hypothetical protein [Actinocrinis sp.]
MTFGHAGDSVADRYRLDRLVAGTADVEHWEAYDTRLARAVALRLEREPGEADEDAADEGAAGEAGPSGAAESEPESTQTRIARLTNPHVAALYDIGVVGSGAERVRYAVSEWSAGRTLGHLMETGPQPWTRVADWGRQTSAGLAALHAIGVAHGALGPDSLAVFDDRRVKIMGAGLEHAVGGGDAAAVAVAAADDVRALGELMWRAVAGTAADAERRLDTEPLREAGMPPVLIELLGEMLADDPAARPTAAAVEERIAPLVPIERAADREAEPSTMPLVVPPTEFGTRTDIAVRDYPTTPIHRGSPAQASKRRSAGLLVGLALLLAAVGAAVGLIIANNVGRTTAPPPPNVTVSGSAGTINLPTPTAPTSSAPPTTATSAPHTSTAATSAPPSSPSATASPSASSSPSSSAASSPAGPASASGTAIGGPPGGPGSPTTVATK